MIRERWIDPVTDRKQSDIDRIYFLINKGWDNFSSSEKEEWLNGLKGALNYKDLVRIKENMKILSEMLEIDIMIQEIPEIPNENYYESVLENTEKIRNAYIIHKDTPKTPSMPVNTFKKWNDIEKIILDVYEILTSEYNYYCGNEIYIESNIGLL